MSPKTARPKRRYEKRLRAEREEETRRRITEAAVELHGSVGPARTTISAVAEEAGVQRATVYRHFPDEGSLFRACSSHWAAAHPIPDPGPWWAIEDPEARVREVLAALYLYYREAEPMLANVLRDAERIPALMAAGEPMRRYLDEAEELLAEPLTGGDEQLRRAVIALALDFRTWRVLARERGLSDEDAVEVMTRAIRGADASA